MDAITSTARGAASMDETCNGARMSPVPSRRKLDPPACSCVDSCRFSRRGTKQRRSCCSARDHTANSAGPIPADTRGLLFPLLAPGNVDEVEASMQHVLANDVPRRECGACRAVRIVQGAWAGAPHPRIC